jgi:ribulose 1,5-bisphosphate synthetase/thiazole synthase
MANCHSCGRILTQINVEATSIQDQTRRWNGVVYSCGSCNASLGVEIDPIALKDAIVAEAVDQIRRLLRP